MFKRWAVLLSAVLVLGLGINCEARAEQASSAATAVQATLGEVSVESTLPPAAAAVDVAATLADTPSPADVQPVNGVFDFSHLDDI